MLSLEIARLCREKGRFCNPTQIAAFPIFSPLLYYLSYLSEVPVSRSETP